MNKRRIITFPFLVVAVLLSFSSCIKQSAIKPSIYYWKTTFDPSREEVAEIKAAGIEKLYLHFFDVKFEQNAVVPVAKLHMETFVPDSMEVVPVVYITNDALQKTEEGDTDTLAYYITRLIFSIGENNHLAFSEIQIDCDWTDGTKVKYFKLLQSIKSISRKEISCTIRLHKIKYKEKTDIPPADRGMLMFYNMGNLRDLKTTNSIFDKTTAEKYLERGLDYPLPLDLALACFSWEVVIRQGKVVALLNEPIADSLLQQNTKSVSEHLHQVSTGFLHQGVWFQAGDIIRSEKSGYNEMKMASDLLTDRLKTPTFNCAFYHWHNDFFHELDSNKIQAVLAPLR